MAQKVAALVALGHAGLAKILADHDVSRKLTPRHRDFGILHLEDHAAIGIGDAAGAPGIFDSGEDVDGAFGGRGQIRGKPAGDLHGRRSSTATENCV